MKKKRGRKPSFLFGADDGNLNPSFALTFTARQICDTRKAHLASRRARFRKLGTKKEKRKINSLFPFLEQMTGIEPACLAWEASALPLSYICTYGETALTVRRQSGLFLHRGLVGDYAIALSLRVKALFLCAAAFLCMMPRAAAWSTFFTAKV